MTEADLEYAAGFFDGDGSIKIDRLKRGRFRLHASVSNVNFEVLGWFKERFGGSLEVKPPGKHRNSRPCKVWVVACRKAKAFLEKILPYMVLKREQADLALEFQGQFKPIGKQNRLTDAEIATRESYKERMSHLKKPFVPNRVSESMVDFPSIEYTAGILDSEGCVTISRTENRYLHWVQVVNSDLPALKRLKNQFGGNFYEVTGKTCHRDRPAWVWILTGKAAVAFLRTVLPHLIVKKKQAELAIEFQELKNDGFKDGEDHKQKISALNRGLVPALA